MYSDATLKERTSSVIRSDFASKKAGDVMSRKVETIPLDWSVQRLATFLVDHDISGAPVVDESGQLCGMVSVTDIVRQTGSGLLDLDPRDDAFYKGLVDCALSREEMRSFHESVDETILVSDIMTPVVFEVGSETPLTEVADAMVKGHIHRVVVSDNGRLKGIVSALDLLSLIAK
ncbi:CBS domain-containing protein [Sansalvadorimonas sp. 2012CJ34-2]|uniref:CBS domain-containing protein n=1 Tax=Parendozoicomonas callyspongiae TaxID=2942213 RepID=A0ABT0PJN3_9GAMM|nr:CBS domain-containing protein [Sansalvadorimonas sp. 2012CJ34-2]MCL6271559.1 CBS domain-containing protein [Sansalvadorimonas sp. 2012CJ34-2]